MKSYYTQLRRNILKLYKHFVSSSKLALQVKLLLQEGKIIFHIHITSENRIQNI